MSLPRFVEGFLFLPAARGVLVAKRTDDCKLVSLELVVHADPAGSLVARATQTHQPQ
jgi:hypothetical protein